MTIPQAPAVGSRVRITEKWPQGTKVVHEGIYTGWCEPDWELDGHHRVPFSEAGHMSGFGMEGPDVTVEILSLPEPESGTWVHVRNSDGGGFGHVFCRDDVRRTEQKCGDADEYRWWWYGNGSWENWAYVQGLGNVEALTAVAR